MKIGNFKIHPICAEVPDPTDEEYASMRDSMRDRKINRPVMLYGAEVVSGKTRVKIGTELGIEIPTIKWFPRAKDSEGIEREIRLLICDEDVFRRHLTAGQRAMLVAPLINTGNGRPGKGELIHPFSVQDGADRADTSDRTMQQAKSVLENGSAALIEAAREGEVSVVDAAKIVDLPKSEQTAAVKAVEKGEAKTVSAAAGKTRKPRRPKAESNGHPVTEVAPLPLPEREPGEDETEAEHDEDMKDADGHPVPKSLRETFSKRETLKGCMDELKAMSKVLDGIINTPGGERLPMAELRVDLKNAREAIRAAMPHAVCPYCKGRGCKTCQTFGWVAIDQYAGIPEERRQKKK